MTAARCALGSSTVRLAAAAVLLLLVCLPRFDMRDPGPIGRFTAGAKDFPWGHPIDQEGYSRLVAYFRGEATADSMIAPFCYRPLAPLLAAPLPAAPMTAIDVVNVACLLLTLGVLEAIGAVLAFGTRGRWAMLLLFAVSFPVFYYGAIGMIDAVAILFASILLLLVLRGAGNAWLVPAAVTAVLAKETNAAFALLPAVATLRSRPGDLAAVVRASLPFAVGVTTYLVVRSPLFLPAAGYFWVPSTTVMVENLTRARTHLSLALTIALPAGAAWWALRTGRAPAVIDTRSRSVLLVGAALAAALYLYSTVSAYTDGRIIWVAYPFLLPLAASLVEARSGLVRRA